MAFMVLLFLLMIPVSCWLGVRLASLPLAAAALDRWSHLIAPIVLMGLRVYIFLRAGSATYLLAWVGRP